jgi:hypothetical protein
MSSRSLEKAREEAPTHHPSYEDTGRQLRIPTSTGPSPAHRTSPTRGHDSSEKAAKQITLLGFTAELSQLSGRNQFRIEFVRAVLKVRLLVVLVDCWCVKLSLILVDSSVGIATGSTTEGSEFESR